MFWLFLKKQFLSQNPKGLAFGFTEKHQFVAKTGWNSRFLGCKVKIPDRIHIIVPYIRFYNFKKKLAQNLNGLTFGFTEKHQFVAKTYQTLYFLVIQSKFWIKYK
jgi:hypothetical protein